MGMAMDPEAIRQRFEANRRKFREERVERAGKEMSGDATSIAPTNNDVVSPCQRRSCLLTYI